MTKTTLWIVVPFLVGVASLEGAAGRRPLPTAAEMPFSTEFMDERDFWTGEPGMALIRGHLESSAIAERIRG